jgi:hypothetical protein
MHRLRLPIGAQQRIQRRLQRDAQRLSARLADGQCAVHEASNDLLAARPGGPDLVDYILELLVGET